MNEKRKADIEKKEAIRATKREHRIIREEIDELF